MPVTTLEPVIELSDFSQGWVPKAEEVGVPPNAVLDATNLLIDAVTGSVVTRKGFKRVTTSASLDGYRLYTINPFTDKNGVDYLMCVVSNDAIGPDNVQVWRYRVSDGNFIRVDTPGRTWASSEGKHWGAVIDNIFFGGGEQEAMYSYDPTRGTPWDASPGTVTYNTWVERGTPPGAGERAKDFAFKEGHAVEYQNEKFEARRGIRYDKWDKDGAKDGIYVKGDRVSTNYDVSSGGSQGSYWRSWECVKKHEPTATIKPGNQSGMWKRVELSRPLNDDGELNADDWNRIPEPPETRIAVWHGNRLFARNDGGAGGKQGVVYSRVAKVGDADNIGEDVIGEPGDPTWDPDDWRSGGAGGAGFQPFETTEGDEITALHSFGYYLLVFKRHSVHVIAGTNPDTWTVRKLANVGSICQMSTEELDGWVYFTSNRGLHRTDGTTVQPVPGSDKIDPWLRQAIKWGDDPRDINLWSYDGYLWMSLPTEKANVNDLVVVYEPITQSFWPLDLQVQTAVVTRKDGIDHMFFSGVNHTQQAEYAVYAWTGTKHQSQSTKTLGGVTKTNYVVNPEFGGGDVFGLPFSYFATTANKVNARAVKIAARSGQFGLELQNTRDKNSNQGDYQGHEGVVSDTGASLPAGDYVIQAFVRRENWATNPDKVPPFAFILSGEFQNVASYQYEGNGWYRIWATETHEGGLCQFGLLTGPNSTVRVDQVIITEGTVGPIPYFDGGGGEGDQVKTYGGERAFLFQYDHDEAVDVDGNHTDDTQDAAYAGTNIPWFMLTSWLPFGVLQEERRIRRMWALLRSNTANIGMRAFRNYQTIDTGAFLDSLSTERGVVYYEGLLPDDAHAIQVEVEGDRAPASVLGISLDTEPRRIRFGRR